MSNESQAEVINNTSSLGLTRNSFTCVDWPHCATREIDMAGWLFDKKKDSINNLTLVASFAVSIFIVLVCFKCYKLYEDGVKHKERGDVEFGDESEVNYGIIKEGDKEFCRVEIRSDTTSVYDTVNSFRFLGNGHATCIGATPTYHDTVTSYKSLLMQRGEPSHYNSVTSYKAFLKQVTQNKNLDVEVKLLENYPVKCKSTEHCVLVEEEGGPFAGVKSKLHPGNVRISADGKKKFRYRRASGEPLGPMRKRSASNPLYNHSCAGATSLPSIHYSVSSDSSNEEDTLSAFRDERRKAFEDRCKKMSRSCSGGKLSNSKDCKNVEEEQETNVNVKKERKRHYSADGCSKTGRPLTGNVHFKISRAFQHELNNLRESISETEPRPEEHVMVAAQDDSSSENPDSSPSSRNSSISSDAIESESDDETQQVTQLSAASDGTTCKSNNFGSSTELLSDHSASASLDGLANIDFSTSPDVVPFSHQKGISSNQTETKQRNGGPTSSSVTLPISVSNSSKLSPSPDLENHNSCDIFISSCECPVEGYNSTTAAAPAPAKISSSTSLYPPSSKPLCPSLPATQPVIPLIVHEFEDSEDTDNSLASNPRLVKRFHVTSVQGSDLASQKSDCRRSSSGGSMFES